MNRPRVSLARLMGVVAIVAFDCGLGRWFLEASEGLGGLLGIGQVLSCGLIGILLARCRARRFAVGFTVAGLAFLVAFLGVDWLDSQEPCRLSRLCLYLNGVLRTMPDAMRSIVLGSPTVDFETSRRGQLFVEACIAVPMLAAALLGGLAGLAMSRRSRSDGEQETAGS